VTLQVLPQRLGGLRLSRVVGIGDQRRPLQHFQAGGGVVGQGDQLLAQSRQRFKDLRTGLHRTHQGQRPDQG